MDLNSSLLKRDSERFYHSPTDFIRLYQYRDRSCICYHDISITQCLAIDALIRFGAMTLNELAAELHLDKSTASRVVDVLERKGYVNKRWERSDRRAVRLEFTSKGHMLHEKIENELIAEQQDLLKGFTAEERDAALKLIDVLVKNARKKFSTISANDKSTKLAS